MTFEEACADPKRPLSISPRDWMLSVEAELHEEEQLTTEVAKRLEGESPEYKDRGNGMERIDLGIDQMAQGCRLVASGLRASKMLDLPPEVRRAMDRIEELLRGAIEPYLLEMIEVSESIERNF